MGKTDPDGVDSRSRKERQDAIDKSSNDFKGITPPPNPNPEGVPEGDRPLPQGG